MRKKVVKESLLIGFIFICIFSVIMPRELGDLDEIWNYNFARTIAEGLVPYKDINMVTTPLLPIINSIFLQIIANELWVMRILAIVLSTSILYLFYKNCKLLIKEENTCYILTAVIGFWMKDYFTIDYNYSVLCIALILLYKDIKNARESQSTYRFSSEWLSGILAGLAICMKQTVGLTLAIASVGYQIFFISNKKEIKKYLKIVGTRAIRCNVTTCYNGSISNF